LGARKFWNKPAVAGRRRDDSDRRYHQTTYKRAPHRFEAGTPDISGPIGLHAAMDYLDAIGRENIWRHDQELAASPRSTFTPEDIRLFGPKTDRAGLVSFLLRTCTPTTW